MSNRYRYRTIALSYEEKSLWHSYLKMLSVERTARFILELGLPFRADEFLDVMRFARACLEVYMSPSREPRSGPFEAPEFPRYWQHYREREGVLGDDLLHQLSQRYPPGSDALLKLPEELQEFVGRDRFADLGDWFAKNFKPTISGYHSWLHSFWQMLRAKSSGVSFRSPPPLEDTQWQAVQLFCDNYYDKTKGLRLRFEEIVSEARRSGPSAWEAALQTFPVDSCVGGYYGWLDTVRKCLQLQLFRNCWRELRDQIGRERMEHFIDWARKFPDQPELPIES